MILPYKDKWPQIHETAFVAPSSDIIGNVQIGADSSVWFQCVIRGDVNLITIGSRTNIQDQSMLHVTRKTNPLVIGNEVSVGHRALLHGCTIHNHVLIGMGAIVMDGAVIEDRCIVGAGTLVTKNFHAPVGSLVMGSPGKVIRLLSEEEIQGVIENGMHYVTESVYFHGLLPGPSRLSLNDPYSDFHFHD